MTQLSILMMGWLASLGCPQDPHPPQDMPETAHQHTNRLADETSPYLLQHAHNPVDWYAWGPEALEKARAEDRPIFLSIGYSACHWCHVMERESFENEEIAAVMNKYFINIKVDREERPDIDDIYMKAVQALTGSGGWPMSVFMTPDLEPFFGGTYFPPEDRYGRRGFPSLVQALGEAWLNDRENVVAQGKKLTEHIRREGRGKAVGDVSPDVVAKAFQMLWQNFDRQWGGFGNAPKFPHSMDIRIVLRHWLASGDKEALRVVRVTLDRMAEGGVYDQLGGGFHRYSTDEKWLIPHFEKMLYDNALLVPVYLEAHLATGDEDYARVARECCEWALREMVTPEGGFASTQDADSEGVEGKFFAWTQDELIEVLGAQHGTWAAAWWGVTVDGNFEHGTSALWRNDPPQQVADELHVELAELEAAMREARIKLFAQRDARVRPGTDDKVLASWNGLMISALAQTYQVLGDERYLDAARRAADYVLTGMRQDDGRLFATARHGRAHLNAYLDDYAFMIQGLVDLYESDFDPRWLRESLKLNEVLLVNFDDPKHGGFYTTGDNHEKLIARLKMPHDGALPSGNGVHALNLLRLAELTGDAELAQAAERTIKSIGNHVNQYPAGYCQMLLAIDFLSAPPREIVIAGEASHPAVREMLATVRGRYLPQRVVALASSQADPALIPLLEGRTPSEGGARAYVCRNYTCKQPVDTAADLALQLDESE
jgi:uncharacterized protein YyaL (SSP411 family)